MVRTVAPPRRRAARSGSGALAHQEEHLTCNEEAVGSSPTSSTIQPRWWSGQHASPSRRRSPVRTRYGVPAPLAGATPPRRRRARRRGGTQTRSAASPGPRGRIPGAARRGGASPPVGTTPPAPAGPRPLYRRGRGSAPRGGSGRAPAAGGSDGTQTCQPQTLVPSGRASASLAFRTKVVGHSSRASCAGAYPPLVPAVAGVGTPGRLWSARPTVKAEVVER